MVALRMKFLKGNMTFRKAENKDNCREKANLNFARQTGSRKGSNHEIRLKKAIMITLM